MTLFSSTKNVTVHFIKNLCINDQGFENDDRSHINTCQGGQNWTSGENTNMMPVSLIFTFSSLLTFCFFILFIYVPGYYSNIWCIWISFNYYFYVRLLPRATHYLFSLFFNFVLNVMPIDHVKNTVITFVVKTKLHLPGSLITFNLRQYCNCDVPAYAQLMLISKREY